MSLVISFLPSQASATLAEEIEAAFLAELQDLTGTEMNMSSVTIEFLGVQIEVTTLGFAFCEPADPYAAPVSTPLPGISYYGCANFATVVADVAVDESGATIQIDVSKIFLDLETDRDETIACSFNGDTLPYTGTVFRDGYTLGQGAVALGVTLEFVNGCFQASLIPGSTALTLTPEEIGTKDQCMAANMNSVVVPVLYPLIQEQMDLAFELVLENMMTDINDALCMATPVVSRTWGSLKTAYR